MSKNLPKGWKVHFYKKIRKPRNGQYKSACGLVSSNVNTKLSEIHDTTCLRCRLKMDNMLKFLSK